MPKQHKIEAKLTVEQQKKVEILKKTLKLNNTELVTTALNNLFEKTQDFHTDKYTLFYNINLIISKHKLMDIKVSEKDKKLIVLLEEFNKKAEKL